MNTAAAPAPAEPRGLIPALVGKPVFWLAFVLLVMALPIVRAVRTELPPPLPVLGTVPSFELTDQYGQPFGSKNLEGKIWVSNFVFTRCPTICPVWTKQMFQIQHRARNLGSYFHMVSFTVDPEHDTPDKLLAYAQANRVSPRAWSFLHGSREKLEDVIIDGMKVHMQKGSDPDDLMAIGHGSHFVLVDAKNQIRGYYRFEDPGSVDAILRDAALLGARGY